MASRTVNKPPTTPATRALAAAAVSFEGLPYDHDPATTNYGREAAEKLDLNPEHVFKTLVVTTDRGGFAVACSPVSGTVDLKSVAAALGCRKVSLAEQRDVERLTGYVFGGVSPVGTRTRLVTLVDDSATALDLMYVSGGRRGFDIAVAPADLTAVTGARFARIRR